MTFLRNITQVTAALLVPLMSTVLVLPPGMDLEICFGEDGHIDYSLNRCQDSSSPKIPVGERTLIDDSTHHTDCFDVTVACSTAQGSVRADGKILSDKSIQKKDPSPAPLLFPKSFAASAGIYLGSTDYSLPAVDIPSYHLISLRTDVLLI